ncbi:hypothetical protein UlMin_008199 [Ulmus minor]
MGKSPGKWIKTVLFGKKTSKSNIAKGREKIGNEKDVVVTAKAVGAEFASVPTSVSHPFPESTERDEHKLEFENREAENSSADGAFSFPENQNAETQESMSHDVPSDPEKIKEEQAATIVQATFRGYLARRAFWALKGIIRLQALIRGHLVRRQAVATLYSMLGIVKFQALIRGRGVRSSGIGLEVQKKCNLIVVEGKVVDPVGVNMSARMTKLTASAFIRKLLAPSPKVMPLHVHYESDEPNSVPSWLERWSGTHFWKPLPQPKKVLDSKSQRKQGNGHAAEPHAGRSKRTRRSHAANTESVSVQATSEIEKPKRNFRKVSSHSTEPVQENPQIELEKVKRNLRKVHNPVVETPVPTEAEVENPKPTLEKEHISSGHDVLEQSTTSVKEKIMKKDMTWAASNLPEVEAGAEPSVTKEASDILSLDQPIEDPGPQAEFISKDDIFPSEQATYESNVLTENTFKEENSSVMNGGLDQKEDLNGTENQKSGRKSYTPAKQERTENGTQSSPTLPSYMAATESAKAKLRLQGSPRLAQEGNEKGNPNRRHSLPSSANSKISSQSPRTHRLVQSGGKGGNKSEKSMSSKDGNGKVVQAEWRR